MISQKRFSSSVIDGTLTRFLSDFIIPTEQHVRVYNYVFDPINGSDTEDILDPGGSGLYVRETDDPTSSDLIGLDKWDLVTNSVLFYTAPHATSSLVLEVATNPEDFGFTLVQPSIARAETAAVEAAASAAAALASEAVTAADVVLTNADVVLTNADVVLTGLDVVSTNADVVLTGLDLAATNADVVLTNADVVLTGLDLVATNADVVLTGLDVVSTNADVVLTGLDVVSTNADVVLTGLDVVATNADVVLTNADVVSSGISETNAGISEDNAAASAAAAGAVGQIITYSGTTAPSGYLVCDASEVSQTTYSDLFAVIGTSFNTTGGAGSPAGGNFRIPPSQIGNLGLFMRGVGATSGAVGTYKVDVFKSHNHTFGYGENVGGANNVAKNSGIENYTEATSFSGDATETRPRSLTVLLCIKF